MICALYIGMLLVIALAPQFFAPVSYEQTDFAEKLQPPGTVATVGKLAGHTYWMGSDKLGRDILSRLIYGTRVSMSVAIVGAAISFLIGVTYGLVAGYSSKHVDNFMMRVVDVIYAYPTLILIILLQVFLTALAQKPPDQTGQLRAAYRQPGQQHRRPLFRLCRNWGGELAQHGASRARPDHPV